MKKQVFLFGFVLIVLSSCFLFRDYKRSQFTYTQNGQTATIPLVVPKGFAKQERTDTAGVSVQSFYYPNGAMIYAAYLTDTTLELQPFSKRSHQPQFHRLGGLVYKGQDGDERFYREIRQGNLRFGYQRVTGETELLFDSATNFASLQKNSLR